MFRCIVRAFKPVNSLKQPVAQISKFHIYSCLRAAEEMEDLQKNPYFDKYADKIKKIQESKPEEFQSKLNVLEQEKQKRIQEKKEAIEEEKKRLHERASQAKAGKLDAIMKTELLEDKTVEEISEIWKEYHKDKPYIFSIIPTDEYEYFMKRAMDFRLFIYPVPRDMGYEFFIQQFDGSMINFTPLIAYQAHGENAPVALKITHYLDFKDRGIVLMRGEPDANVLSLQESQLLALQVKMYYGLNAGLKFNLVRMFNNTPDMFRHQDLIKEFENLKKDIETAKNLK